MGFLDKIKGLLKNKEIPIEEVNKTLGESAQSIIEDEIKPEQNSTKNKDELTEIKLEKSELSQILDSLNINKEELALSKIESEAETINSYAKGLIKDLGLHQDFKNKDKDKFEAAIKAIGGKIKVINNHCLELKNLLANLEDHYYNLILDALRRVYEKTNKEDIQKLIWVVEGDLNLVKELDTQLTKIVGYNELFNPDKNAQYKDEIEKEAMKRIIHGDLNNLINQIINTIVDKSLGIKSKIEKNDPLKNAKELI